MGHEIELGKYQIRTDLAIDVIKKDIKGIKSTIVEDGNLIITEVEVLKEGSISIGKKEGKYITIEFEDITDHQNREKVKTCFTEQLKKMIDLLKIDDEDKCLVIGLGNEKSTPDSLGPLSIDNIIVTNHLFVLGEVEEGFRPVATLSPGVMGETGIETSDIITSVVKVFKPAFVIVIDALASQSLDRVNRTIQMTDSGIHPGSGVGNGRREISSKSLGVPVIAIGVPTVVDAVTIVSDTINYMHKHFTYTKESIHNPSSKLTFNNVNYLKKKIELKKDDRENLLGMLGSLSDVEMKQLLFEVLTPIGYNLMVTPKEVDFIIDKLSDVIGNGINKALHKKVDN